MLGVTPARQVYLGLPDGKLEAHLGDLHMALAEVAFDFQPQRIFTTGRAGYDGHRDHIAAHIASAGVMADLHSAGMEARLWGLEADHQGELVASGQFALKVGAMALHASQRISSDLRYWGGGELYTPLITHGESFTEEGVV